MKQFLVEVEYSNALVKVVRTIQAESEEEAKDIAENCGLDTEDKDVSFSLECYNLCHSNVVNTKEI